MTPKERAAMQQALDALDVLLTEPMAKIAADKAEALLLRAAPTLREALSEQAEPMTDTELINANCRYTTPLMAEQAEQEPVAWMWACTECGTEAEDGTDGRICSSCGYHKFYKAPKDTAYVCEARAQEQPHPDDEAVDRFAAAMKAKLEKKRAEGRGGWEDKNQCSAEFLNRLLNEHVGKGDPVDVGNLAMMLWNRGEHTETRAQADHIADAGKMVTTPKVTLPKQGKCECGDKCFPIFSGNMEYCETCGWPIVSGEDHNPHKVDEKALLEALAKQARHLNVEPVKLFTSDDIKVAFENGYAAAMSVADVAKETEQEPVNVDAINTSSEYVDEIENNRHEPVAWVNKERTQSIEWLKIAPEHGTKLYTAPVRTKDLTFREMNVAYDKAIKDTDCNDAHTEGLRAVIAAYKEKNHV